jgi:hypothetical protein
MIWDILNQMINNIIVSYAVLYSVLPQSPLYIDSATIAALTSVLGYAAWFLPITAALAILSVYVAGIATWFLVVITVHFVEQVTP